MFRDIFQAKSAYEFMQCPEQNFFVDTLSNILHLNLVNALSHMSKIPEDIIENNLHNIIEKFVVSAVDVKTNTVCWTITGSMTPKRKSALYGIAMHRQADYRITNTINTGTLHSSCGVPENNCKQNNNRNRRKLFYV